VTLWEVLFVVFPDECRDAIRECLARSLHGAYTNVQTHHLDAENQCRHLRVN
jgi:hypothetical protein